MQRFPPPKRPTESDFQFLNRVAGEPWDVTRELLEAWYRDYDDTDNDLRGRFRDPTTAQHMGAWWELYIYTMFRRLGYDITIHPNLPATNKKPDFLLSKGSTELIVECAVMLEEAQWADSDGRKWVLQCINDTQDPNFLVGVDINAEGMQRPRCDDIVKPIRAWLATLDANAVWESTQSGGDWPEKEFVIRGWRITLRAIPLRPERRGLAAGLIGIGPMKTGWLRHVEQIRGILSDKGSKYGQPEQPFVLALLASPITAGEDEMTNALYGSLGMTVVVNESDLSSGEWSRQQDGYWRPAPDIRGSRISAVLFAEALSPSRPFSALPRIWMNPWAKAPLESLPPFAAFVVEDDQLVSREATTMPKDLFGYPSQWPHGS
ncbi:hemin-binding protein [Mycobacterium haemophilum]|uniref:Hemin-binding protein n=2 Tax=Mycobacterium haemophilum TaxID=29311 RepID=A0A0I9TY10_9MYCO|nr:hemin-binding protein [Mycobacterium haemophilum]KLO39235.1 hemin-binding protein [Mycobacterium haemophilum]KLO45541.1 hemin-binding protein [Mycobacterium haemophilum]KLO56693.1 hemin-binding protein [Mycobacterium haemophilum]